MTIPSYLTLIFQGRLWVIFYLGFCSGLPLALTGSTLQAWFTVSHVDLVTIGALTLIGQPYVYKFLWAPCFDRYTCPGLDRRRGWLLVMQLGLVITLGFMAFLNPAHTPKTIALIAVMVSIFSASQDTVFDAYRAEILAVEEVGMGSAISMLGYRIAMLVSGGLALILADSIGWRQTYLLMAAFLLLGMICTGFAPNPVQPSLPHKGNASCSTLLAPFKELWSRPKIILLLLFVVCYKFGDAFALSLITNFLINGLGFSLTAIGGIYKTVGLIATLLGAFAAGVLLTRISLYRGLMWFGLLQALSLLAYWYLAIVGKVYFVMISAIFVEYFCAGMGTTALMVFLTKLCNKQYTATQYALLAAIAAIGRVFVGPIAAQVALHWGWVTFFSCAFIGGLPALPLLYYLRSQPIFQNRNNDNL